ncbi:hypothetical protein BVG16_21780 [Paenibacillus selenitireducens]|uniref:Uncharacterized protein n=1 Tax=Paenibacillus selenitireducens TaxID=1324314 RepID=A0A1T2X5V2_9BACL|nr:hypothetical protein [Paenibacillus selenitireducens]OPA75232.1 hypothetical protein BVG16_21780 [Paenibacillus selenitireducens]
MAKPKRGRSLWRLPSRGRGTCPICSSTRIKLLYPRTKSNGSVVQVCKRCSKADQMKVEAISS